MVFSCHPIEILFPWLLWLSLCRYTFFLSTACGSSILIHFNVIILYKYHKVWEQCCFCFKTDVISLIELSKCRIARFRDFEYHPALDVKGASLISSDNGGWDSIHMECEQTTICDTWVCLIMKSFEILPDMCPFAGPSWPRFMLRKLCITC